MCGQDVLIGFFVEPQPASPTCCFAPLSELQPFHGTNVSHSAGPVSERSKCRAQLSAQKSSQDLKALMA